MITLITGKPGAGKTSYLVAELLSGKYKDRPIYIDGILDLDFPHEVPPDSPEKWYEWAPDGALIVIDECQRVFRPRPNGSKVPPHVALLETHRHKGLDFIVLTQGPNLIDANLKALVGRHLHIRPTAFGRKLYEAPEVFNPESKGDRTSVDSRSYKLPKQVYGMYKSATIHTKQERRLPKSAILFVVCLLIAIVLGVRLYLSVTGRISEAKTATAAPGTGSAQPNTPPAGQGSHQQTQQAPVGVRPLDFVPVVPNRPETAPIFDTQRQVKAMEWPDACIASKSRCVCYSGQGTLIRTVDEPTCRDIVANGRHNPYKDAPQYAGPSGQAVTPPKGPAAPSGPQIAQFDAAKQAPAYQPFGGMKSTEDKS